MKKIKIVGALIFLLSLALAAIFYHTSKTISQHNALMSIMNEQKNFTQEISKHIFYIYQYPESTTKRLDESIKLFSNSMSGREQGLQKSKKIIDLWNNFYLHVQHFRDSIKISSPYSNTLLEKEVKTIYNINFALILESDKFIKEYKKDFEERLNNYKTVEYLLFLILLFLLLYIFTQLKDVIAFVQKFLFASKKILSKSSIKELQPIKINNTNSNIHNANDNFNTFLEKINGSIQDASSSIEHSYKSLEIVEQNIEDLVELIYTMNEGSRDKELRKKEDAIIQSFEELGISTKKLINLKKDLDNLIFHNK
jgi:methyl-accepting chemotaxis protein